MIETIRSLCALPGVSGWEDSVRAWIRAEAEPYADELLEDANGSLLVFKRGRRRPEKTILLAAHMDEVGVIVREITAEGFLRFGFIGGVDRRVVIGKQVRLGANAVPGVIGMKPIHLTSHDEETKIPKFDDLYIDIGASSREEAAQLTHPGDWGVFLPDWKELGGDFVEAKALDDRVGCGVLLELLRGELPVDCWFAFTVQEEVGTRGAFGAAFRLRPEIALVVEGTTAADSPLSAGADRVCAPGEGPVIPFMDGATVYDRGVFELLRGCAEKLGIPWQVKTRVAGGTDARTLQRSREGCRVGAVSAAVRYIHSPSSVGNICDFRQMKQLLDAFLQHWEDQHE